MDSNQDGQISAGSKVAHNELLMNNILLGADEETIRQCFLVCRQWYFMAKAIDRSKRNITHIIAVFLLERFNSVYLTQSRSLSIDLTNYLTISSQFKGTGIFEYQFFQSLSSSYASPKCLILFEGNNVKKVGKKRCWKRAKVINTIRSIIPHDCAVIGIDAHHGIVGQLYDSDLAHPVDPCTISYDICGLFGISCFMLPKYEGVSISIFERATDELEEEFKIPTDIKALILFSSGVDYRGDYLAHSQVDAIFDHYKGKIALGGAQVNDKLVTRQPTVLYFSDDTANFYFTNGPPPYNSKFNPKKLPLIGVQFSGPNISAASITIDPLLYNDTVDSNMTAELVERELEHIESTLYEFRSSLDFPCDIKDAYNESIAFLFFNFVSYRRFVTHRRDMNAGISIFHKVFPRTHITGIVCHAPYQHSFINGQVNQVNSHNFNHPPEEMDSGRRFYGDSPTESNGPQPPLLPSPTSIASFVIINIRK